MNSKRRLAQLYSPAQQILAYFSPNKRISVEQTKKKLNFSPSPMRCTTTTTQSVVEIINEDSCDSGYAEDYTQQYTRVERCQDLNISIEHQTTTPLSEESIQNESMQQVEEAEEEERLIGDLTRKHTLPILNKSKHSDLASITPETLSDLIDGKYCSQIGKYLILDARYPYEYTGGHINCAESAYSKDLLFDKLFKQPLVDSITGEPLVLVFHCEFSSERGPRLMREIRERDRALNKQAYPRLHYPEMYLLEGGYKSFFESFETKCEPKCYVQMLDDNHRQDLKFFRKKSKSLDLENKKRSLKTKLSF
jgi:hypothetical protein